MVLIVKYHYYVIKNRSMLFVQGLVVIMDQECSTQKLNVLKILMVGQIT